MFVYVFCTVVLVPGEPLRIYRGNLKNVSVCILYYRRCACSQRENQNNLYVNVVLYCSIGAWRSLLSYRGNLN